METLPIKIYDETLRDGEQQAGIFFSYPTKEKLASLIARTGVDGLDIMPCVCEQEAELAKTLVLKGLRGLLTAATLMNKQFIDLAKECGIERIILFHGLSDRLLFLRDTQIRLLSEFKGKTIDDNIPLTVINKIRQNAIDFIVENLCYATTVAGLRVDFAAEDASRADFDFLVQCLRSFSPYIESFILCDTVGILNPEKSYIWIRDLFECTERVVLGVHYHNDRGMALENTLQSVMAGATLVSGTFGGIGERAGNVAVEQVLNGLRFRFGIEVQGINYDAIIALTDYIDKLGVRPSNLPLSFAQQRLWFLHQLSPESNAYNLLEALRLEGALNIVALEQSLSELIRRHEILRTNFPMVEGKPLQRITPPIAVTLPIQDLQGLSTEQQTAQFRQIAIAASLEPFDLAGEPLVQFTLLKLSDREYILLLKMHHIIYDGWSLSIFFGELSQLYAAFAQGLPSPLTELPIQYADFAVWQRQWLTGKVLDRQLNYWREQLAGLTPVLELPTDYSRPPVQTFQGGTECFQLDRDLTQRLKQLSQESDATLFMTLLAAFLVLISRYSGQLDLVVGSPIANRNNKSVEQLMGFFANTLAIRGNLSGNPSFAEFHAQVRQTTLSAYAHQDLPFEMLVEKLQLDRDLSRNPLVQVMFCLQNTPQSSGNLSGLTIQNLSLPLDGPTESTVCATVATLNNTPEKITIGRPINNIQVYILDEFLQPVPIGVPGELYIGGDGLARGYLHRPELTSEKFIPHPFSNSKSQRLYKTGDLARYSRDGNIIFIGRIDNQVKVRGFRIELGEVEAVLNSHCQIQQAVVIARVDRNNNKRLVAYVVSDNKSLSTHQLREFLKTKLPEYMIPGAFVSLDSLPLTSNGKLDHKALPVPSGKISRQHEYVAPRTQIELQLTQIWSSVLNITSVGVRDNFFTLGGHSLLAVHLMSQIQKQFQKNLPLATLFQFSTIEELALLIGSDSSSQLWSPLVPIQPNGSLPALFVIGGAEGSVFYFQNLARYLGNNQPFYGLQPQGIDGETKPLSSIEEIASQYIKAIQTVQSVGPYFLLGYSFGASVAFEMAQQLQRIGQSVAYVAILDAFAPISHVNHKHDFSNWDNAKWICEFAPLFGEYLLLSYEELACLTPEQQLNYVKQQLELLGYLPPQTDIKIIHGFLQVFKTQCQIEYVPQKISPTTITLFCASETISQQGVSERFSQEPTWGWNQFYDEKVEIITIPGTHTSIMTEPNVKILAEKLQVSLRKAYIANLNEDNSY